MREFFEKIALRDYSKNIKGEFREKDPEILRDKIKLIESRSEYFLNTPEKQTEIYEIQEKKLEIMKGLRENLRKIDNNELVEIEEVEGRNVRNVKKEGDFYFVDDIRVTLGTIFTDYDWGNDYNLDPLTVPRDVRKRYIVERTSSLIGELLDEQIAINEHSSGFTDEGKKQAYGTRLPENKKESLERGGFVAEKLVKTILKKLEIDHEAEFDVKDVDFFEDVEYKIDFIVETKNRLRGVDVESDSKSTGIQFTINTNKDVGEKKGKQTEMSKQKMSLTLEKKVDDLVLVIIPLRHLMARYKDWVNAGMPPGGPEADNFDMKKRIIRGVLRELISSEKIEEYCKKLNKKETPKQEDVATKKDKITMETERRIQESLENGSIEQNYLSIEQIAQEVNSLNPRERLSNSLKELKAQKAELKDSDLSEISINKKRELNKKIDYIYRLLWRLSEIEKILGDNLILDENRKTNPDYEKEKRYFQVKINVLFEKFKKRIRYTE
ncbi:MAG: hypothetical protein PHV68_08335 [Candidatus Gastranaerophilales bacterium]|nr:hypothetical protein [Candidatus Gastranaerophilales bacterium]